MEANEQLEALKDIRKMMNRSVRFLSLSGLSGLFAGLYALIAAYIVYDYLGGLVYIEIFSTDDLQFFIILAISTLFLAIFTAYFFTRRKAKKAGVSIWDETAKNALINLCIPLFVGGIFCLALINAGLFGLLAPVTLIFYGLSLVNASKHTFPVIRQLGLIEIALGLINAFFIGYGLIFWVIGFGILHIIYGLYMYYKYDRV